MIEGLVNFDRLFHNVESIFSLVSLHILDPPGAPQIQGLDENEVLIAGNLKRITCTSISGNPLATLKWFNGDKELVSIYLTRDNYASAEVAFVPKGSDNGGQLRCEATNMASMQPLMATRNLSVDFAPEFVKIAVRPERPRAGHNVTLVCETGSSYQPRLLLGGPMENN